MFYVKLNLYILLYWKTQAHYTALFQVIEDFSQFTPLTIHYDFESAIHKAVHSWIFEFLA